MPVSSLQLNDYLLELTDSRDAQAPLAYSAKRLSSDGSNNDDNDWPVHSLMSHDDLRGLPLFIYHRRPSMSLNSISRWQTWTNHDELRRWTVENKRS